MSLEDQPQNPLQFFPISIQEWAFFEVSLHLLTIWALGNKINNVTLHSTPTIMLSQITIYIGCTRMYRIPQTMCLCKNSVNQIINTGHTYSPLNRQDAFKNNHSLLSLSLLYYISNLAKFLINIPLSLNLTKRRIT